MSEVKGLSDKAKQIFQLLLTQDVGDNLTPHGFHRCDISRTLYLTKSHKRLDFTRFI